jgi:hypothetical protein
MHRRLVGPLAAVAVAVVGFSPVFHADGFTLQWGAEGDTPLTADFDGDEGADLVAWRPATGHFYVAKSGNGYDRDNPLDIAWGTAGDIPLVADVDGDDKADAIVYRPSTKTFRVNPSSAGWDGSTCLCIAASALGSSGFTPLAADVDGDGKADLGAFEPDANGNGDSRFRFLTSRTSYSPTFSRWQEWGASGDVPVLANISSASAVDLLAYRRSVGQWYGINADSGLPVRRVLPVDPNDADAYHYAPDFIKQGSDLYAFSCHTPVASSATDLDSIAVAKSTDDGLTWTTPARILEANAGTEATTGMTGNIAYCDPSIVHYGGFYYLYNSNTLITNPSGSCDGVACLQTYVTVSRIADTEPLDAAASNWLTYTERGTWEHRPTDAKAMILPQRLITSGSIGYGAGEQSVIVKDGQLEMFYVDDSYLTPPPNFDRTIDNCWTVWKKTTSNPVDWSGAATQTNACGHSPVVKYDGSRERYVLLRIAWAHSTSARLVAQYSTNAGGTSFGPHVEILDSTQLPDNAHNVGVEGDEYGHLVAGNPLAGWGAPADGRINAQWFTPWDVAGTRLDVASGNPAPASTAYDFGGPSGAQPLVGHIDGDAPEDLAFFDPSAGSGHEWTFSSSGAPYPASPNLVADVSAVAGDVGLLGRFHGTSGEDDLAVWHPATGDWEITYSSGAVHAP